MSRSLRDQGVLPSNEPSRLLWHMQGTLTDLRLLFDLYDQATEPDARMLISKHALVVLCIFHNLAKKLEHYFATTKEYSFTGVEQEATRTAYRQYRKATRGDMKLLRELRNTLGAHRTALPSTHEFKRYGSELEAWGAWEHRLAEMEEKAELINWIEHSNACVALFNYLKEVRVYSWFSWNDQDELLGFSFPVRLPADDEVGSESAPGSRRKAQGARDDV